jgi:3-methyladenine DNA glycosylase/8-oxoguanine DNA glycosylase
MGSHSGRAPLTIPLVGAGGERVSFRGTIRSHGLASLPPNEIGDGERTLLTTVRCSDGRARTIELSESSPGILGIAIAGRAPNAAVRAGVVAAVRAMFALDDDLCPFYRNLGAGADLAFVREAGIGRFLRSPTAFEDVVRTICTTNCTWSATERMNGAIVEHLGARAEGAPATGWKGRAFPSPAAMAEAPESFYRDVARAGYRGAYFRTLARMASDGEIDVEAWRAAPRSELPDAELEKRLLALPGVGPYAAAHTMMLFGRTSRLILDSWTRPRYAMLKGKKKIADRTIARHFKPYGDYAGLAFWLSLWKERHLCD